MIFLIYLKILKTIFSRDSGHTLCDLGATARSMLQQEVFEEPIIPIYIDRDQEIQAYYSRIDELTSKAPGYPNNQSPYPSFQEPYPTGNYPQHYPSMPGVQAPYPSASNSPYNMNSYGYQNQYFQHNPPQYNNAASTPYGYPYPYPTEYPQSNFSNSFQPQPAYPPQVPAMGGPAAQPWSGHPYSHPNAPYPYQTYTPDTGMPGNNTQSTDSTTAFGWADVLLPAEPSPYSNNHRTTTNRTFANEEIIAASHAPRNFNERYQSQTIGWNI